MPADQAAGLRRRNARQPLHCIHCFSDSAESSVKLARALHRLGQTSLLIDTQGRLFAASPTRSLFDWKQQLERGQLHTLPLACGDGWHAPGVRADEPLLCARLGDYDRVVFDAEPGGRDLTLMPDTAHTLVIEVQATQDSILHAYRLLKTLSWIERVAGACLLGAPTACSRLHAACQNFLGQRFAQSIYNVANEDDVFAALAVRITGEGTS